MMNASDALSAHARSKTPFADVLDTHAFHAPYYCELAPDLECPVVQFMRENAGDPALEPELTQVRIAHAAMHCAMIALAQRRNTGQPIDITGEFGSLGEFGAASETLIDSIHRLDRKMQHLTG